MKFLGAIFTECVSTLVIVESDNILDVVKDFIALGIISEIDDLMATTLKNIKIKEEINRARKDMKYPAYHKVTTIKEFYNLEVERLNEKYKDNKKTYYIYGYKIWNIICISIYFIIDYLYVVVYFYFF